MVVDSLFTLMLFFAFRSVSLNNFVTGVLCFKIEWAPTCGTSVQPEGGVHPWVSARHWKIGESCCLPCPAPSPLLLCAELVFLHSADGCPEGTKTNETIFFFFKFQKGQERNRKACDSLTNKHQFFLCLKDTTYLHFHPYFISLYSSLATYLVDHLYRF